MCSMYLWFEKLKLKVTELENNAAVAAKHGGGGSYLHILFQHAVTPFRVKVFLTWSASRPQHGPSEEPVVVSQLGLSELMAVVLAWSLGLAWWYLGVQVGPAWAYSRGTDRDQGGGSFS
eukprot:g27537.t1